MRASASHGLGLIAALAISLVACSGDNISPDVIVEKPGAGAATLPPPTATPEPITTLLFTGDVIPARCTLTKLRAIGSYDAAFDAVRDILTRADIAIGTLDSTLADSAVPLGCTETFNLAGPREFADALGRAGYDVMSHAANHIRDCGNAACGDLAVTQTIANLRRDGIASAGSGATLAAAREPVIITRNGIRFAFLAYDDIAPYYTATESSAGSAPLDTTTIGEDIARARAAADVVVVIPHWGVEYTAAPSERQRLAARVAAISGADVIVGNHPHWVQAHEQLGDVFVAYALGNFVFDQDWSLATQQGAMLELTFTGRRLTGFRYIPVHVWDEYQPRVADPDEAAQILDRIEAASHALE